MIANSTTSGFKILVDADACPVKDIIIKVAQEYNIAVVFIASVAHKTNNLDDYAEYIWVDSSPQAVDMVIINRISPGDLVVTADYGLAGLVLAKSGRAISPRGRIYNSDNIETLLTQRHIEAKIRQGGGRTKGPKAMTIQDKNRFEFSLRKILA